MDNIYINYIFDQVIADVTETQMRYCLYQLLP